LNDFTSQQKTKTLIPPPNTPVPDEAMSDDNEMQDDCSSNTFYACNMTITNSIPSDKAHTEMEIDEHDTVATSSTPLDPTPATTPTSWADEVNNDEIIIRPNTSPTIGGDIRKVNPLEEHSKILELCIEVDKCERDINAIIQWFLNIRTEGPSKIKPSTKAIMTKIGYRDRNFFRTFARETSLKGQHQIEYENIEKGFHDNYLKTNNIGYINRTTRKKIRAIINKALFITFLKSTDLSALKHWQIAQLLEYGFNFFIDPTSEKLDYQTLSLKCEEAIKNKLPLLPTSPDLVPTSIKIKLPHAIPITSPRHTADVASSLRAYYNFDQLPASFFIQRPTIPDNPSDLKPEVKTLFPLTKRSDLRNLRELSNKLRDHYYVPSKLPDSYFELPPPKSTLPSSYMDLPSELSHHFPVENCPEAIRSVVDLLRTNNYAVRRLPMDYIQVKRPLPPAHWYSENNSIPLPIQSQEEVKNLIQSLKQKFFFKLPLGPEWIRENLVQDERPHIPDNVEELKNQLNITDEQLHRDSSTFPQTFKKIKDTYQGSIPREWILPILPNLPSITETKEQLEKSNINITLPLIEDQNLTTAIKLLKTHFYFDKLPPTFITEKELPDPGLTLLPCLF
jgi:hypothetical protein